MGKNLQYKILLSLLAAGSISVYGFVNTATAAEPEFVYDGNRFSETDERYTYSGNGSLILNSNDDMPTDSDLPEPTDPNKPAVRFAYAGDAIAGNELQSNNNYGNSTLTINGGDIDVSYLFGYRVTYPTNGLNLENVTIENNKLTVTGGNFLKDVTLSGSNSNTIQGIKLFKNSVYIDGLESSNGIYGIFGAEGYNSEENNVTIKSSTITIGNTFHGISGALATSSIGVTNKNSVNIIDSTLVINDADGYITGAYSYGSANSNEITITNSTVTAPAIIGGFAGKDSINNTVKINGTSKITGEVYGGSSNDGEAYDNTVIISGGSVSGDVYGGYINLDYRGSAYDNEIIISGSADITNANLYGRNDKASGTGNTLTIDGWSDSTKSVQNFNSINFDNINWQNGGTVLTITEGAENDLANTEIYLNSIAGGSKIAVGDTMTLIESNKSVNLGIKKDNIKVKDNFFAGVATEGTGTATVNDDGSVDFKVDTLKANSQIDLVAENRAVAAAFVNQGTDLISDSLDTISRDSNYGVKTFAAVHGNRSKYDVNSDIKINGWSTIVGVGNADKFDNGSEFSWGVFYENGSGNYRTYNEFNNEFFRGDGSLVYNGGGIAARYTNKNGVYTEGSLRAGMLKSDMDNALRDGAGNFYGYESESAYYGAHLGIGKIISLSESSDLDVYGKFFHTYTEGDSFKVAGDEFEFDSINSNRLRIGARITSNKENKFSTYYGLAYEYEFNGDADMTAQGLKAPTQSLQGSSVMAEVGFNYQPTPDSPWSFDLNMRGYTGERQGGSFNVQATYTF